MESAIGKVNVGFVIVAQKPYSEREADSNLSIVGGVRQNADGTWQAVTWYYVHDVDGFGQGDYSRPVETRGEALRYMVRSFAGRGLGREDMLDAYQAGRRRG